MSFLLWLANTKIGRGIAAGVAMFLALLALRHKLRADGAADAKAERTKATVDAIVKHDKVKKEIRNETDDELLARTTRKPLSLYLRSRSD